MIVASKHHLRLLIGHYPLLFLPILRLRLRLIGEKKSQVVSHETEILIEGAGGSANSFSHIAFKFSQPCMVNLSGHTHAPAQVIQAIRWNIPTLVLIREPVESISSLASRKDVATNEEVEKMSFMWLENYVHFYKHIIPYKSKFIVADFNEVIHDFGNVIKKVNEKFFTNFIPFEHTEQSMQECFQLSKRIKPSQVRGARKLAIKTLITNSSCFRTILDEANELYSTLTKSKIT